MEVARSGMPYTCAAPGKATSKARAMGPLGRESVWLWKVSAHDSPAAGALCFTSKLSSPRALNTTVQGLTLVHLSAQR